MEVVMTDNTRVDCMLKAYAIEFDFAKKWAEGLAQAIHYARLTGLRPGLVLICRRLKDKEKLRQVKLNSDFYNLKITIYDFCPGCIRGDIADKEWCQEHCAGVYKND